MSEMPDVLERFMRYVAIDSQSDPKNESETPSTKTQFDMAALLKSELEELGCTDVVADEHAYVIASYPASAGAEGAPVLMLCAHIDSAIDAPGSGVKPHVVTYEGGELTHGVVEGKPVVSTTAEVPDLAKFEGQDIVCSDGTTLLSADDKAGVAEICSLLKRLDDDKSLAHPELRIVFVPDEEIGHGASLLDIEKLGASYGYTVDGGPLGEFSYECFSASQAVVSFHGTVVHPGSAKDIMVNALTLAAEFQERVPAAERPEHTEGREGFYHPISISGTPLECTLEYIIRDFDSKNFASREQTLEDIAASMNARYGEERVNVSIKEQYRNMAEKFEGLEFLIDDALEANRRAGIEPWVEPVRGGTDGAQLSFRGLPCPNLATGAYNMHSVREFIPVSNLVRSVDMLVELVALLAARRS